MRTTLDPTLQRMARTALIDGFVAYDHRHAGWRGPVKKIDIKGDWGKTLGAHAGVERYRSLAARRGARRHQGQRDDRTAPRPHAGRRAWSRSARPASIPYEEVKWARPKVGGSFGGTPASVSAVLKPGDVVYVSPRLPKPAADGTPGAPDDSLKGQWSLQQVPEVSGALVAMDPHTGRVLCDRWRLQLRRKPVRPRDASPPPAGLLVQAADLRDRARQRLHAVEHHRRRPNLRRSRQGRKTGSGISVINFCLASASIATPAISGPRMSAIAALWPGANSPIAACRSSERGARC